MRCSRSFLLTLLSLCISLVAGHEDFDNLPSASQDSFPEHITLHQWPLDASRPSPLGRIAYNPQTKQGKYFSLSQSVDNKVHGLVRVGIQVDNGGWLGTVVDAEALDPAKHNPEVTIRVDHSGKVFHVEFSSTVDLSTSPQVIVLPPTDGPTPALNKPIVVGPDGRVPEPPVEKTFLQKYWWLILAGMVLYLSGGSGEQ